METWEIKVLHLGQIQSYLSWSWPSWLPPLEKEIATKAPYLGFLLQKEGQNIIVDTGISEKFIVDGKAWRGLPAEGGSSYLRKALEKEGLAPEDIETVIYTHLHNDHAGNCELFPEARIIFQKDEWANLTSPLPLQVIKKDYDPGVIPLLNSMNSLMVDGDIELTDGIRLFKTPGHSLGSQSVAVNTQKGTVVLIGDLCSRDCYTFPQLGEVSDLEGNKYSVPKAPPSVGLAVPSGMIYDYYSFYTSMSKVKAIASRDEPGFIISGHDAALIHTGI